MLLKQLFWYQTENQLKKLDVDTKSWLCLWSDLTKIELNIISMLFQKGLQIATHYAQGSQISSIMHLDLFHLPLGFGNLLLFCLKFNATLKSFT